MKIFLVLFFMIFFTTSLSGQIGTTLPQNRILDWTNAGLKNPNISAANFYNLKEDFGAAGNGATDDTQALKAAINTANNQAGISEIYLPPGIYKVTEAIALKSNIIIRGSGPTNGPNKVSNGTRITLTSSDNQSFVHGLFKVYGTLHNEWKTIGSYSSSQKRIIISSSFSGNPTLTGKLAIIKPLSNSTTNQVGAVIPIQSGSYTTIYLEDEIDLTWNLKGNTVLTIAIAEPIENVGIEDISIEEELVSESNGGYASGTYSQRYFDFKYALNSWVKNVETFKPHGSHIVINYSYGMEVKDSYMHDSWKYIGGFAYGVALGSYTTNSLIEDNIMKKMRHAILVSKGANKNVVNFNYARENSHCCYGASGDINLHGDFPYANLFEGNRIDRIDLDNYYASSESPYDSTRTNGSYNTFFRNFTYEFVDNYEPWNHGMRHLDTDLTNILGNETKLTYSDAYTTWFSSNVIDLYGYKRIFGGITMQRSVFGPEPPNYYDVQMSHEEYQRPNWYLNYSIFLNDKSYFYSQKPSFFSGTNITWPAIGPRVSPGSTSLTQDIPARHSYCNEYPSDCSDYPNNLKINRSNVSIEEEKSSVKLSQNYPNPFNPSTNISFELPNATFVQLEVFDLKGSRIVTLVNEKRSAGFYTEIFNTSNLSSGVYIYRLTTENLSQTKKFTLIK